MLDTLNLTKKSTMDDPLIVQFQDVVQSRKVLSDHLNKFCERMPSLLHEQRDLNAEIQLVNQKIKWRQSQKKQVIWTWLSKNIGTNSKKFGKR